MPWSSNGQRATLRGGTGNTGTEPIRPAVTVAGSASVVSVRPVEEADVEEAPPDAAIWCRGLTRHFPSRTALAGLDLTVARGEVLALLGPNGAGKTTTVRLLNGVLRPDEGSASVLGIDPTTNGDALRRRTGVLTENAGLDDRLTATENLAFTAAMRGMDPTLAGDRVAEMLARFGMDEVAHERCQGFSTGQRRRVALARALLHDPEVLFLDEPTSGLDPAATADVVRLIEQLARDRGRTIILCTHFLGEAARVADQMAILHRGRLLTSGRPSELAASLWPGIEVDIDLGGPAASDTTHWVSTLPRVISAEPTAAGMLVVAEHRDVIPHLVAALGRADLSVYGITPRERTLEDVYFAYEDHLLDQHREPEPTGVTP